MNTCWQPERWRSSLSAVLDGEDPEIPREQLDAHLAGCAPCDEWFEQASQQQTLLRSAGGPLRDITAHLIGVTEAHICSCHTGGDCECTDCVCPTCTCHDRAS